MIRFEENIATDLSHFLTAVEGIWDIELQQSEWVIYLIGIEVDRIYSPLKTGEAVIRAGGYEAKAAGLIKSLWDAA